MGSNKLINAVGLWPFLVIGHWKVGCCRYVLSRHSLLLPKLENKKLNKYWGIIKVIPIFSPQFLFKSHFSPKTLKYLFCYVIFPFVLFNFFCRVIIIPRQKILCPSNVINGNLYFSSWILKLSKIPTRNWNILLQYMEHSPNQTST